MKVLKYILKWTLLFLAISIFTFFIVRLIPVNPVEMLLQKYNLPLTDFNKNNLIQEYGLDKNIFTQYLIWLTDLLRLDFGVSFISKLSIRDEMFKRIPYSLIIGLSSLLISIVLSFFLGYLAAIRENKFFDKLSRIISVISLSLPPFIVAILIIYYFGVKTKSIRFFTGGSTWSIIFSIIILVFYQVGALARIVKNSFMELKNKTFVKFYVIRGFSLEYVLLRHAYKPVLYSLLSASVSRFSSVIGGSSVLEFAFTIPGVSYFLISSIVARDYNVIQAYIMLIFVWMLGVHIVIDSILLLLKEKVK